MASATLQDPYMLAHRQGNIEEDRRLDAQHETVKLGMLDGRLIHDAIPVDEIRGAIADVGCGTGVWLNDVARSYFSSRLDADPPMLVGWDPNPSRFTKTPEPGVQLHRHDCTQPFPQSFHSKFDLVHIRLLAYAVWEDGFDRLVENACQLLRPGGYLLWFDSEMSNFSSSTPCPEVEKAIQIIREERRARKLVPYLPPFMLNTLLRLKSSSLYASSPSAPPTGDLMSIIHFQHYAVGPIEANRSKDAEMIERVNDLCLEAIKLLLMAAITRKQTLVDSTSNEEHKESLEGEIKESNELVAFLDTARADGSVKMVGQLPCVVARKW